MTEFPSVAVQYSLVDLKLSVVAIFLVDGFINSGWSVRFLVSRLHPDRRLLFVATRFVGVVAWLLASIETDPPRNILFLTAAETSFAFDASLVEAEMLARRSDVGACLRATYVGKFFGSLFGGYGVHFNNERTVFFWVALLQLSGLFLAPIFTAARYEPIPSEPLPEKANTMEFALLLAACYAAPHFSTALYYFATDELGLTPVHMGAIDAAVHVAVFVGLSKKCVHHKKALVALGAGIVQAPLLTWLLVRRHTTFWGVPDTLMMILVYVTACGLASYADRAFSEKVAEETTDPARYTFLLGLPRVGRIVGLVGGVGLTSVFGVDHRTYSGIDDLVRVCALCALVPFCATFFVWRRGESKT